jgi:hypothetical protein
MPGGELELARLDDRVRRCHNYPITNLVLEKNILSVRALYAFDARKDSELSFQRGDIIEVLYQDGGAGWWEGYLLGKRGLFPSNYCEVCCTPHTKHIHAIVLCVLASHNSS